METLSWLLLALPLLSAALGKFVFGKKDSLAMAVSLASVLATLAISITFIISGKDFSISYEWITLPSFSIQIGMIHDHLSSGMMLIVTGIGFLVHLFSVEYMKEDQAKGRYFTCLSLFMFSMTGIVLANNFIMMFIFWELVGLSSYLLIGHWFHKESAAGAARKAFLANRIGDFGFMVGILLLWGITGTFIFEDMSLPSGITAGLMTATILCIFCGALGKSAQFPLHVWLADAMEGPTPVSALIHAATMVAAGVYMLFRVQLSLGHEVFHNVGGDIISWIGAITALLAALMATQQDDIKKVLAYSTLSQLGYMVLAVGLSGRSGAFAAEAGMFHLYTHAWFKALLFLGSGAVIFACHHEQNIWKMGGLLKKMSITGITFAIGTAALIAVPFITSGFYSKEEILIATLDHGNVTPLFVIAAIVAALTPFYMMRLFVIAFLGKSRSDNASHAKEVPLLMWLPLVLLAIMAVISGFKGVPNALSAIDPREHGGHHDGAQLAMIVSIASLLIGSILGFILYVGKTKDPLANKTIFHVFRNKFYIDELYNWGIKYIHNMLAGVVHFLDTFLINGLIVGGIAGMANATGALFRRIQSGSLQGYATVFAIGTLAVIYFTVFFSS